MLIQNRSIYGDNIGLQSSSAAMSVNRSQMGSRQINHLNKYVGQANMSKKSGVPDGYLNPYSWELPRDNGGMATRATIINATAGNMLAGKLMSATILNHFDVTDAACGLIVNLLATISNNFAMSADMNARVNMTADLAMHGNLTAAMGALIGMTADLTIDFNADNSVLGGIANMSADLKSYTSLTTQGMADAVWNAFVVQYQKTGTMGKAMSDAGSAGNPWAAPVSGNTNSGTMGEKVGKKLLDTGTFIALK